MKILPLLPSAILLALLSVQAQACGDEAALYSRSYDQCMEQAASTAAMQDCIAAEHAGQDKLLNDNYKKLMAALTAPRQPQLREAQQLWLRYRDANCRLYADPAGGSAAALAAADCALAATAARAVELAKLMPEQH
ncbi:lysozyme inhibitor LprI family protein [Chromobacterium sphagni]|uniref:Lysozyme inhibitor LprI-like N-terminal domain-containing protein n=1 Tax=Chromobacterium sphagni TaxID=1903179 RepID=A0ABX3CIQ6_9NEIS|nr:lysozyme inhibitor LprI family protein [Chromobacterium sphagni]OHX22041.1 hypothetical protein BI344_05985 [Chromobacterium sphagni]